MYSLRISKAFDFATRRRGISGFSNIGPRNLEDICKINLFEREDPKKCRQIWTDFHANKNDAVGLVLDSPSCLAILKRARQCPNFVHPFFTGSDNSHMVLFSQFQRNAFLYTTLEDFRSGRGTLCLSVTLFDDMLRTKGIGLLRADFLPTISKKEATVLCAMLVESYSTNATFGWVDEFNLSPKTFDYDAYLNWAANKFQNRFVS